MKYHFEDWNVKVIQNPNTLLKTIKSYNIKGKKIKKLELVGFAFNFDYLDYKKGKKESLYKDNKLFYRYVEIDEPFIIEFEDGNRLEIDYSECSSIKIGLNSLPKDLKSLIREPNIDPNILFSDCVGKEIIGFEVRMVDELELKQFYTGSHDIKEPSSQTGYISKLCILLSDNVMIEFSSFYDYGRVGTSSWTNNPQKIKWEELKNGIKDL